MTPLVMVKVLDQHSKLARDCFERLHFARQAHDVPVKVRRRAVQAHQLVEPLLPELGDSVNKGRITFEQRLGLVDRLKIDRHQKPFPFTSGNVQILTYLTSSSLGS